VKAGSIKGDLFRRDFTINAMAMDLNPADYGTLLDSFGGVEDLNSGLIRVLHERSFTDDATRIWRAIRYEQRLGFDIESGTLQLLERDLPSLGTVSGDRIRHELELALKEERPERVLYRAGELGVLAKLHPSLKADGWLAGKFAEARQKALDGSPSLELYLALLAYPLSESEVDRLAGYLRLTRKVAQVLRAVCDIKAELDLLAEPELTPGGIYAVLHGQSQTALTAVALASDSRVVKERLHLYLEKLRYVKPALTGADLSRMGFSGARIREVLEMLRRARLDGEARSRSDEERLVEDLTEN
jgi:tRNA nucleotidyltransferase (CCA-adding enzyme)